ncbi:hypothetical protein BAUCODRAFT_379824 [Baudoinia panamericana UAMH 10762]|uniref:Uncharacterized protein n=1 Tax=Baudoinia panamericana (strain UAMH 10762) TaxID=717646 RepID=M2N452_BAUPA|nr:uncharacterized protein BAUCODRAFT_379824 [Baudoinia panamericana UAMH 10762]EMC98768.1 hypothetical protein BAUCODRAFT_379824 [Baudoinia panamericana UAMH 10762]
MSRLPNVKAITEYTEAYANDVDAHNDEQAARLLEALYIIDCYRVVMMMRPPTLMWHTLTRLAAQAQQGSRLTSVIRSAAALVDGTVLPRPANGEDCSLASLASLAPHLWTVLYPRRNQHKGDTVLAEALRIGKPDFVEIACEKWIQSGVAVPSTDMTALLLYHMIGINLHANLSTLQTFAYLGTGSETHGHRGRSMAEEIHCWLEERDYDVAHWHAEQLTTIVEASLTHPKADASLRSRSSLSSGNTAEPRKVVYEAPHVPYAIYYATLVLYVKGAAMRDRLSAPLVRAPLVRGERLLSFLKVAVAQPLARMLCDMS